MKMTNKILFAGSFALLFVATASLQAADALTGLIPSPEAR